MFLTSQVAAKFAATYNAQRNQTIVKVNRCDCLVA
jgi:hypothetical protein